MIWFDGGLPCIRHQRVFGQVFGGVRNQHEQALEQQTLLESLRTYPCTFCLRQSPVLP